MAVYFLADIHLSEQQPEITAAFTQTLNTLGQLQPEGVFILGDLFDYYLGDTLMTTFQQHIADQLRTLAEQTPVFYQHGNRDFLIKSAFAERSGVTLLPERYQIELDNHRVLLEHGDLLCTDDVDYQRLRKVLRHPLTYTIYHCIPTALKKRIARYLRQKSQQSGQRKPANITDTNVPMMETVMQTFKANTLIHGHTHRPKIQPLNTGICYVLGDWRPHGQIICYKNEKFNLINSNELA